ncbi:hypothetical protein [Moorena producens]|uniref:hypothetical protein n=1 Tax=Moorena producens TaxID=1155739 RepID=UPI003C723CAF
MLTFPTPDSRLPFPSWEGLGVGSDSRFPTPVPLLGGVRGGFRFPTPDSRFPTPYSLLPTPLKTLYLDHDSFPISLLFPGQDD